MRKDYSAAFPRSLAIASAALGRSMENTVSGVTTAPRSVPTMT